MKTKLLALTICFFLSSWLSAQSLAVWDELKDYETKILIFNFLI